MNIYEKTNNTIKLNFQLHEGDDRVENDSLPSESFLKEAMPIIQTIYKVFYTDNEERRVL